MKDGKFEITRQEFNDLKSDVKELHKIFDKVTDLAISTKTQLNNVKKQALTEIVNGSGTTDQKRAAIQTTFGVDANTATKVLQQLGLESNKSFSIGYNESSFGNHIIFYDADKNKISEEDVYHYIPSETQQILNAWVTPPHVATVFIPAGTAFVKIKYFCSFKKTQSYGCIGRLMAEYE